MREERTLMAAMIAGGLCSHDTATFNPNNDSVATKALGIADAIIAKVDADERAAEETNRAALLASMRARDAEAPQDPIPPPPVVDNMKATAPTSEPVTADGYSSSDQPE